MRLLVVGDEEHIRKLCFEVGRQCCMRVTAVATAEEAFNILDGKYADIAITDLRLRESPGLDLIRQIIEKYQGAAVIVVTRYGSTHSAVNAIRLGAGDYVTKPFRIEERHEVVALEDLERRAIFNSLLKTTGDRTAAARMLGIGRTTLYRKLKQYNLNRDIANE